MTLLTTTLILVSSAYFFERLFWTISGRERLLKRQFVRFVTDQMSETEDILVSLNKSSVILTQLIF